MLNARKPSRAAFLGDMGQFCFLHRSNAMFDLVYVLIGAGFLGACILYAIACEHM
jgi:hypothetical protein